MADFLTGLGHGIKRHFFVDLGGIHMSTKFHSSRSRMGNFNDREGHKMLSLLPEGQILIVHFHQ